MTNEWEKSKGGDQVRKEFEKKVVNGLDLRTPNRSCLHGVTTVWPTVFNRADPANNIFRGYGLISVSVLR